MIILKRILPIKIKKDEALLRRIMKTHTKFPIIEENLRTRLAGYRGEQNLDYHLKLLPEKDFFIFQGLHLKTKEITFQIDALVLSTRMFTIIESKNLQGKLTFDNHQMIRSLDQKEKGYTNPIAQVKRHQLLFQQWLEEHKLKTCPIEHLVSISNPSTIIKVEKTTRNRVFHAEHIPFKIQELEKAYPQQTISHLQLQKLCNHLIKENTLIEYNVLDSYEISPTEILPGVVCPQCKQLSMSRTYGGWLCPSCSHKSRQAHKEAIEDYLLLYSRITNRQCKQFLQISSNHVATRLLKSMNLTTHGTLKGTSYNLPTV